MGCDIHGYWELYHPQFKRWIAFRMINDGRSYNWFGILSGVRGEGPLVASLIDAGPSFAGQSSKSITEEEITSDDEDFSVAWRRYVAQWGEDLHSFTVVPYDEVRKANAIYRFCQMQNIYPVSLTQAQIEEICDPDFGLEDDDELLSDPDDEDPRNDREPLPGPNDIIERLILDMKRDADWEVHPKNLPMNVPLGEIIGTYDPKEVAKLVRMVVAYDN
jgi:hypothetical protein